MTFPEYYEEVAALGFDSDIEDFRKAFLSAMNRGFRDITRIRPRMASTKYALDNSAYTCHSVNVKEEVKDDYGSLPMNPVRTLDGLLYDNRKYTFLNKDTIMFLPNAETGTYIIDYRRKAKKFTENDFESEEEIDLDDDLSYALTLLVAYYTFLDDDAEKATQYLARYNEEKATIERTQITHTPNGYFNRNGW